MSTESLVLGKTNAFKPSWNFVHHNLCKVKEKLRVTKTIQISFRLLSRDRSSWLKINSVVWIRLKTNPLPKGILLLRNMYHIEVDCAMSGPSPSSFRGVWTAVEVDAIEMSGCKSRNSLRSPNKKDDKATNIGRYEIKSHKLVSSATYQSRTLKSFYGGWDLGFAWLSCPQEQKLKYKKYIIQINTKNWPLVRGEALNLVVQHLQPTKSLFRAS